LRNGGIETTVLNAANEEAVHLFLEGKIPFLDIEHACSLALANFPNIMRPTLRDILTTDSLTRLYVRRKFAGQLNHANLHHDLILLLMLGILVSAHEAGHLVMAKLLMCIVWNIRSASAPSFSLGKRKGGETRFLDSGLAA
jgi:GGDEF domain-containing protein